MSHAKQSSVSQTTQGETALQLGTTIVRFYQYISDLCNDNPEIVTDNGHATLDSVIKTLGQFSKDISARNLTVNSTFMSRELSNIVGDCKRGCESVRNGIQAWLQLFPRGCTSRFGSEPPPSLSDIVTKGNRRDKDEPGGRNMHLEHQQRAIKELLTLNQYAQANPRPSSRI
ncbi:hypothetical protein FALCPG4_009471 [Fusarium falciforme]